MNHAPPDSRQVPPDGHHVPPGRHAPFADERAAARWWLDNVYAGDDAVQLSPRAVVSGMAIGGLMSVSNLYVGLKTGWGLGVTITSCITSEASHRSGSIDRT